MVGYRGRGQVHKRWPGTRISYGTGEALCANFIPKEQLTTHWPKVTCKKCGRKRPNA